MTGETELARLSRLVARMEDTGQVDHDALVALNARVDEYRIAHQAVHSRDDAQHAKDYTELQRRLDVLNHAHEEARRKESDFASKDEVDVATLDLIRRIESVQSLVGICLPRETFEAAQKTLREDGAKRDDQISNLFVQVQGLAANEQGSATGAARVTAFVFAAIGALVAVVGIVLALTR